MSSAEFTEWQAFERLEGPLGPERWDWRFAMIASTVANTNRDPKKRRQEYRPDEFIPDWAGSSGVRKPQLHPLEVADKARAFFHSLAEKRGGRR